MTDRDSTYPNLEFMTIADLLLLLQAYEEGPEFYRDNDAEFIASLKKELKRKTLIKPTVKQ